MANRIRDSRGRFISQAQQEALNILAFIREHGEAKPKAKAVKYEPDHRGDNLKITVEKMENGGRWVLVFRNKTGSSLMPPLDIQEIKFDFPTKEKAQDELLFLKFYDELSATNRGR